MLAAPQSAAEKAAKAAKYAAELAAAGSSTIARKAVKIPSGGTLVVCMVSIVGQWLDEARSKLAEGSTLKMHMYHNQGRERDPVELAKYDLVVTTYQTLGSDYGKDKTGNFAPLGAIDWHRIILDESHNIKSPKVQQSMACTALISDRRWCCTGTPITTDVADLLGQLVFLRLSPLDKQHVFDEHVKRVFSATGSHYGGSPITLLYALSRTMVRHTKAQTLGGTAVLSLPPKKEVCIGVDFSADERAAYDKAHAAAKAQFDLIKQQGQSAVSQRILQIMALLLPLRRIASGGALCAKDIEVTDLAAAAAARAATAAAKAAATAAANAAMFSLPGPLGPSGVKPEGKVRSGAGPSTAGGPSSGAGVIIAAADDEDEKAAIDAALASDAKPVLTMANDADELCNLCEDVCEEPVRCVTQACVCVETLR